MSQFVMEKELSELSRFICSAAVLEKDELLQLSLSRHRLYASEEFQFFSNAINAIPGIARLVEARGKASNAFHGDITRQIIEDGISFCWKRSSLNDENLTRRFQEQIRQLTNFEKVGFLLVPMAILLPFGIEERVELPEGTLEPLSERNLRHFSDLVGNSAISWLNHGLGKAVYLTHGSQSYEELIEGNLSRGPDHNDHYGLLLLQLAIIIHYLSSGGEIPKLSPEMGCQSGAISGGTGFNKNIQHGRPQFMISKSDMRTIAGRAAVLHSSKFPHFPARRFVEALTHDRSQEDKLVDCVTGWEGLLMPGEKNELGFRLSLALAVLLEGQGTGPEIALQVKRIYGLRSKIVHGDFKLEVRGKKGPSGQLKYEIELREACAKALAFTKQLLCRMIENPNLILSGSEGMTDKIIAKLFGK